MDETITDLDFSTWLSTYGLLTAQRILEGFKIQLTHAEFIEAVKTKENIYHHFLHVPLKHIYNGIVLQQAQDLQVYIQKLFVDYLMSGEGSKDPSLPGAATREEIETERLKLVDLEQRLGEVEAVHHTAIAKTVKHLMECSGQPIDLLNASNFASTLTPYETEATDLGDQLRAYRRQFYDLILHINDLLRSLPDYHLDESQIAQHRESLQFDTNLGESEH